MITVEELVDALKKFKPNDEVQVEDDMIDYVVSDVNVGSVGPVIIVSHRKED